jgi:hypothetical protein
MARDTATASKGVSLAKGPVAIIGIAGLIYGISALIFGGHGFAVHVPHGAVHGKKWLGLEVNGWSDLLFIAAGMLLLFSAPLHWGAKSMSLLVGLVLGAAAVIAVIRKDGVFGIFAANHLTELVWAAAAVLLILMALLPRVGGGGEDREDGGPSGARATSRRSPSAQRSGRRSRRVVKRDQAAGETQPADQHARYLEKAAEQDRPPRAGAQRTDDNRLDKEI